MKNSRSPSRKGYLKESSQSQILKNSSTHLEKSVKVSRVKFVKIVPRLPPINPDMKVLLDFSLSPGPQNDVLVNGFGISFKKRDMLTLSGTNWLNDQVINFYMNLINQRSELDNIPNVYAMNCFFYPKIISGGQESTKTWTKIIDIFSKDIILVPVHLGAHWCLAVIDFRKKLILYYDSKGSPNFQCMNVLKQYLIDEHIEKKSLLLISQDGPFKMLLIIPSKQMVVIVGYLYV